MSKFRKRRRSLSALRMSKMRRMLRFKSYLELLKISTTKRPCKFMKSSSLRLLRSLTKKRGDFADLRKRLKKMAVKEEVNQVIVEENGKLVEVIQVVVEERQVLY